MPEGIVSNVTISLSDCFVKQIMLILYIKESDG